MIPVLRWIAAGRNRLVVMDWRWQIGPQSGGMVGALCCGSGDCGWTAPLQFDSELQMQVLDRGEYTPLQIRNDDTTGVNTSTRAQTAPHSVTQSREGGRGMAVNSLL